MKEEEQLLKLALGLPVCSHFIANLASGRRGCRHLDPNFYPGRDLNPELLDWQTSILTTRPPFITQFNERPRIPRSRQFFCPRP